MKIENVEQRGNATAAIHAGCLTTSEYLSEAYQAEERDYLFEKHTDSLTRAIWNYAEGLGGCDRAFVTAALNNPDVALSFKLLNEYGDLKTNPAFIEEARNEAAIIANAVFSDAVISANFKTIDALIESLLTDEEVFYIVHVALNEKVYENDILNVKDILEQPTENTNEKSEKMNHNNANNDNQNSEQNNTTLNEVNNMSNQNTNTEQNSEQNNKREKFISLMVEIGLKPRSSLLSKLAELNEVQTALDNAYKTDISYYDMSILEHKSFDLRLKISKMVLKKANITAKEDNVYHVAYLLMDTCSKIVEGIEEGRKDKKPTVSKAITHTEAVEYARALTEGHKNRSSGVARDLKSAALLIAYRNSNNALDSEDVDKALDKVYAAVRRQGKKNEVDLGGKSNKPTKEAAKAAILEVLLRMINGHEYEFSVIIGEC